MWQSILLKEWLKLRWSFTAALVVNLGVCIKIMLDIRQRMQIEHAEMVWYEAIHMHTLFYQPLRYLPLMTGLVLAAAQFAPEMLGRRMRIGLHLPVSRDAMLLVCLLVGLLHVAVVCLLDVAAVYAMTRMYFPAEVASAALYTMAPWCMAGVLAYLGSVTVLLEPAWPRRLFYAAVFAALVSVYCAGRGYGWFGAELHWFSLLLLPALLGTFEPCRRFQYGGVR